MEEFSKKHWLKIALISFAAAFLAFYLVMEIMIHRITSPKYEFQRIEKMIQKEANRLDNYMENPFEPRMKPMLVNLIKEGSEYRVIVDLKPLDGNEKCVNVNIEDKVLIISGELDKNQHGNEKIIKFSQAYYLDDELLVDKISKEKKGDKYIITIPYED